MRSEWDGSDDQYDESYDWDTENYISGEMEFSGPDEDELEAAMEVTCSCEEEKSASEECGHSADCSNCECRYESCKFCDCLENHCHQDELCKQCECDDDMSEQERTEDDSHENYLSEIFTTILDGLADNSPQEVSWGFVEDKQLISHYASDVDFGDISIALGIPVNVLKLRLLFLCFQAKGVDLNSPKGANSGKKWSRDEELALTLSYRSGTSLESLAVLHQRSRGAIAARLVSLRLAIPIDLESFHGDS